MADIVDIPTKPTGHLLPKVRTLALIDLAIMFLPRWKFLFGAGMIFATFYAGVVLLSTRDMAQCPWRMSRIERGLCRWSGPLALAVIGLLVLIGYLPEVVYGNRLPRWLDEHALRATFLLGIEFAAIFAAACVYGRKAMRHIWPHAGWRLVCAPLLILLILIVVLGKVVLVAEAVGWP